MLSEKRQKNISSISIKQIQSVGKFVLDNRNDAIEVISLYMAVQK